MLIVSIPYRFNETIKAHTDGFVALVSIPYRFNETKPSKEPDQPVVVFQFLIGSMRREGERP